MSDSSNGDGNDRNKDVDNPDGDVHQSNVHLKTYSGDHSEGGHGEPWLVSYADMMTLLFGFFVLLYSFEAAKNKVESAPQEMVQMRKEVSKYFGGTYVNPLEEVGKIFQMSLSQQGLKEQVKFEVTPEGIELTFSSKALFASGEAELEGPARDLIKLLADSIGKLHENFMLRVEGHTDDAPIATARFPSNWELSASRASSVVRIFEAAGFEAGKLTAVGYGSSRPAVPNLDETGRPIPENRARNRRIIIRAARQMTAPAELGPAPASAAGPGAAAAGPPEPGSAMESANTATSAPANPNPATPTPSAPAPSAEAAGVPLPPPLTAPPPISH